MLRLITDFDGPIMDVSPRYYEVYRFCLEKSREAGQEITELTATQFWQLKRARVPEREIGRMSGLKPAQAQHFAHLRKETVHTIGYLSYDRPLEGAIATLERIKSLGFDLVVMTMRRVKELDAALNQHDLGKFFPGDRRYCLANDYVKTGDTKDKPLLMARALAELPPATDIWMVGDTEADIIAALSHNIKVIAVLSGIRDRASLAEYRPDYIVNNLSEAVDLITARVPALT